MSTMGLDAVDASGAASSGISNVSSNQLGVRSTALSNKLVNVLSASYADLDIRDALSTLDERQIQNTPQTRRQLRLDVQRDIIECNGEIVRDFGQVAHQLQRIGATITRLNQCCDDLRQHVAAAQSETAPMLAEAASSLSQRHQTQTKQLILDAVHAQFSLSEDDLRTLTAAAEPVDDHFFVLLTRLQQMHDDCQVLLGAEDQTLGLAIMDQRSRTLNAAFQKLFQWIQGAFRSLNLENPQIGSPIRRALRVLAERPSLFQNCLDFFAAAREHILSDAFYAALTGGVAEADERSSSKPIELFAHDPLRYVGDMLAWVHSATVSEREALEVLFVSEGDEMAKTIQAGLDRDPWSRSVATEGSSFDGQQALRDLVNRDLDGVGRLLRQRVEQVVQSHDEPTMAYRLGTLVDFYRVTFVKLLGGGSSLVDTLRALHESAQRQFRATMKDQTAALQVDLPPAPEDLSPPAFLESALKQLHVLMVNYDSALVPEATRTSDFRQTLNEALSPFLRSCEGVAQDLDEPAQSIFVLNCLLATRNTVKGFAFTEARVAELHETIGQRAATLVEHQHGFFLHTSGLFPMVTALGSLPDTDEAIEKIASLPPFEPSTLTETSQTLDDFLPSAVMDATEQLKRLQDSGMVQDITEEAAGRFCEDFEMVEAKILALDQLHEDEPHAGVVSPPLRAHFPRTSADIRVLLS
ncbi:MAG: Golgi transport complex subunit 6 [Thelocarpon superellum]|nr:MAG: Golgi transport complex subunit 6 [Thelocarpon superellum]